MVVVLDVLTRRIIAPCLGLARVDGLSPCRIFHRSKGACSGETSEYDIGPRCFACVAGSPTRACAKSRKNDRSHSAHAARFLRPANRCCSPSDLRSDWVLEWYGPDADAGGTRPPFPRVVPPCQARRRVVASCRCGASPRTVTGGSRWPSQGGEPVAGAHGHVMANGPWTSKH